MSLILVVSLTACGSAGKTEQTPIVPGERGEAGEAENAEGTEAAPESQVPKNGDIYILFTSDVHCGIDQGFGYAGLQQIRKTLEENEYETLLVDNGDSIQGEAVGTLSRGEAIIDLMNAAGYDAAVPGNHESDYGTDRFLALAEKADFPYICCNFTYLHSRPDFGKTGGSGR